MLFVESEKLAYRQLTSLWIVPGATIPDLLNLDEELKAFIVCLSGDDKRFKVLYDRRLRQMLINLASNVIRFTDSGRMTVMLLLKTQNSITA